MTHTLRSLLLSAALSAALSCVAKPSHQKPSAAPLPAGETIRVHGQNATPDDVIALLGKVRFVFLGELHDNPRHHAVQAELLGQIVAAGRRPALAFEMLEVGQTLMVRQQTDPAAFGKATRWDERGWPDYAMYEPLVRIAMANNMPIVPANLDRKELQAAVMNGALPDILGVLQPLPTAAHAAIADNVRKGHCGHADDAMVARLAAMQELRDAYLAQRMLAAATADGAVLISGAEHANRDHGAAFHVAHAPNIAAADVVSIGLFEKDAPASGYDVIWTTPATVREDPCVAFKEKLERMREAR